MILIFFSGDAGSRTRVRNKPSSNDYERSRCIGFTQCTSSDGLINTLARVFGLPASNQTAYEPQRDCPLALLRRNQVPPMRGLGRRRGYEPRMLSQRRLRGDWDSIPVNALGT